MDGQGIHVSLFAVANCFGRLLAGYAPQYALDAHGISRPWFLALLGVMTSISALFNAFADIDYLIFGTILTGASASLFDRLKGFPVKGFRVFSYFGV
jgi:hypothetical protein